LGTGRSKSTTGTYVAYARAFLEHSGGEITAEARDAFLSSLTGRYGPRSVANVKASLNQFFRFLLESGYEVPQDLLPRLTEREEEILREFSDYLTLEGKRPHTVKVYRLHARAWLRWCKKRGLDPLLVTEEEAKEFLLEIRKRPGRGGRPTLSPRAIESYINDLRRFYEFLAWKFRRPDLENPFSRFKFPRRERKLPRVLTLEEVDRLFRAAARLSLRHLAVVRFIYATGARLSEAANLRWEDVDLRRRQAVIRGGKGGKDRVVFFDRETARVLKRWREASWGAKTDRVFLYKKPRSLGRLVREAAEAAGLGKVTSHMLRHSLGTHLAELGFSAPVIQGILGHERLETTGIYIHLSPNHLKQEYERFWRKRAQVRGER